MQKAYDSWQTAQIWTKRNQDKSNNMMIRNYRHETSSHWAPDEYKAILRVRRALTRSRMKLIGLKEIDLKTAFTHQIDRVSTIAIFVQYCVRKRKRVGQTMPQTTLQAGFGIPAFFVIRNSSWCSCDFISYAGERGGTDKIWYSKSATSAHRLGVPG